MNGEICLAYVDEVFIDNLKDIMKEPWEVDNRATWKDGSEIATKRVLQVVNNYDLSEGFPILSLRKINWKAAIDEVLWIYQRLSNDVQDLKSSIWNSWKDEEDKIHKAYGYQIAKPTMGFPSQMHYVLNEIKTNPTSRRILMNMFNAEEQQAKSIKSLIECAYGTEISVKNGKLHYTLTQRSNDFITANNWNLLQYSALAQIIAMECDLGLGNFQHRIQDQHIYNKHYEQAEELLTRLDELDPTNRVYLKINKKPFFELTIDDFELVNYNPLKGVGKIEVAV